MTTGLVIERGDPRTPEAKALLEASHALMQELFTPDANHFLSLDALAAPDIAFFVAASSTTPSIAASSSAVSPFARSAMRKPAICAAVASPARIAETAVRAMASGRSSPERRVVRSAGQPPCSSRVDIVQIVDAAAIEAVDEAWPW